MEILELKARNRHGKGKTYTQKARKEGWIPAVIYGHGIESESIEVDWREFSHLFRKKLTSHLIALCFDKNKKVTAIVKEIQRHMLKEEEFIHIDFQNVKMDEKVTVKCYVEIVGIPEEVKSGEAILDHPVRELSVECLPSDIPEKIEVDVSHLKIGDSIHVKDISLDSGELKDSEDEVVASVVVPKKEEESAPSDEEAGEAAEAGEGEAAADTAEGAGEEQESSDTEKAE